MHRVTKTVFAGLAFAAVAGCTATPLYQSTQGQTISNPVYAQTIAFAAPENRVGQVLRNKVIFQLYGGSGEPANAALQGSFSVRARKDNVFRTTNTSIGQTSAGVVTVTGTLTVTDTTTGTVVEEIKRSAIAPIDIGNQRFATERAELDAENRAAEELGEQFATLLASRILR